MGTATTFIGNVHPQGGGWYFSEAVEAICGSERITIMVTHSIFNVRVTSPDETEVTSDWVWQVWARVAAALRGTLDALGLFKGAALELEWVGAAVEQKGSALPTPVQPYFAYVHDAHVGGDKLAPLTWHSIDNANLRHALADVRQALRLDGDSSFHCYRAIESLRQHYLIGDEDDGSARTLSWEALRDELGVPRQDIDSIRKAAMSRRHGGSDAVTYVERVNQVKWTRDLVMKFVERLPVEGPGRLPELNE